MPLGSPGRLPGGGDTRLKDRATWHQLDEASGSREWGAVGHSVGEAVEGAGVIWGIVVCISRFKAVQPETPEHKETYPKDEGPVTAILSERVVVQVLACFLPVLPCSVFDRTCVQLFASSTPCYIRAHVPTAVGNIWNEHSLQRLGGRAR